MKSVNIHEAKTHFSKLVDEAAEGEEIVIAKAGKPTARLVPMQKPTKIRRKGLLKGKMTIAADFDAPLPDDFMKQFHK